jgi:hypothetical protein
LQTTIHLNLHLVINNSFRNHLVKTVPSADSLNLNDPVELIHATVLPPGVSKADILHAFIKAWRTGCWVMTGIAVAQFLLSLLLRRVDLNNGKTRKEEEGEKVV